MSVTYRTLSRARDLLLLADSSDFQRYQEKRNVLEQLLLQVFWNPNTKDELPKEFELKRINFSEEELRILLNDFGIQNIAEVKETNCTMIGGRIFVVTLS